MLPCRLRAPRASSSSTSDHLVAAWIVSFVLVSSCSWCAAQKVVDIAPEDISRYYPGVTYNIYNNVFYNLVTNKEPVTVLLRSDPKPVFKTNVWPPEDGGELVITNGWRPDCQLRFKTTKSNEERPATCWVYENAGSDGFHLLTRVYAFAVRNFHLTKQADGSTILEVSGSGRRQVPVNDCVLETKSVGDSVVYNLTFAGDVDVTWFLWPDERTVFVRLEEPTTTTEDPTTTQEGSKPAVVAQTLPSHSTSPNANASSNNSTPRKPSAAEGLQLGPFVAAVVVMQLFVTFFFLSA